MNPMLSSILLKNAAIFDGKHETLTKGLDVLVEGNKIAKITRSLRAPKGSTVIEAQGRTMTPGFIDAHSHIMFQMSYAEGLNSDEFYWAYFSTQTARTYLTRGFTTIREMGGNAFSENCTSTAGPAI